MHWELSDEQEMFASSLREWIEAKYPSPAVRELHEGDGGAFIQSLIGEGWWGVGYAEDVGGQGGGVLELALAAREFGRSAVPDSRWLAAALAAPVLTPDELAAQLSGECCYALALPADQVPDYRGAPAGEATVDGVVPYVLAGSAADIFLVPVTETEWARVPAAGVSLAATTLLDRSKSAATVTFAQAPVATVVTARAGVFADIAARAAALVAADSLGAAERMLDLTVGYTKQRKQFGKFIGEFQAVKHAAAQMLVGVEASFSTALYAAAGIDAELDNRDTVVAVAKAQVTETSAVLADSSLTVHGAIGYTWEHDLQLYYKRAKLDRVLFGAPKQWNEKVAAALLD